MKHVVNISGGLGSFWAAHRVIQKEGPNDVTLLFADTLVEDDCLYAFLDRASELLGVPITRISEGLTPWQLFRRKGAIGNSAHPICSFLLKREPMDLWRSHFAEVAKEINSLRATVSLWTQKAALKAITPQIKRHLGRFMRAPRAAKPEQASNGSELELSKPQQRVLDALAWFESIGNTEPSNVQVGAVALMDATGGYFSNTVGPLSTYGLIQRNVGSMSLTDLGRKHASTPEGVSTMEDYHEVLRQRVRRARSASGKTVEILDAIIEKNGEELSVGEIGEKVGIDHTGGYFSNSIGPLSTLGLIRRERGVVVPTEVLFPPGL